MYFYVQVNFHIYLWFQSDEQENYLIFVFQIVPLLLGLFGCDGQARSSNKFTSERKKVSDYHTISIEIFLIVAFTTQYLLPTIYGWVAAASK